MARAVAFACAMALVAPSSAGRIVQDVHLHGNLTADFESPDARFGNNVDFSFMTTQRKIPLPEAKGLLNKIGFSGAPDATEGKKEDIVEGHTCMKQGEADQTYYASSMCYWMPEIQSGEQNWGSAAALSWNPGKTAWNNGGKEMNLCGKFTGKGECVKCSICHNGNLKLGRKTFVETVKLRSGCMKETAIDATCKEQYEVSMQPTTAKIADCTAAKKLVADATANVKNGEKLIGDLTGLQESFVKGVAGKERDVSKLEGEKTVATEGETDARAKLGSECVALNEQAGPLPFLPLLADNASTPEVLAKAAFECGAPVKPDAPSQPTAPVKPVGLRTVMPPGKVQPACKNAHPSLRQAKVVRKVTLDGSVSTTKFSGMEFIERPESKAMTWETYWSTAGDYLIYRCKKTSTWILAPASEWKQIQSGVCATRSGYFLAEFPKSTDILATGKFAMCGSSKCSSLSVKSAGTAGPLINTITIGASGLPYKAKGLSGLYSERRDEVFQVNGRETYWSNDGQGLIYKCAAHDRWVLAGGSLAAAKKDTDCEGIARTEKGVDILSTWGNAYAKFEKGAIGVVALGTAPQCVFANKLYAASGSGGYLGSSVFQEPSLASCMKRCRDAEGCEFVTHWTNGTCYLQSGNAMLWEPTGDGSAFPVAAAATCPEGSQSAPLASDVSEQLEPRYGTMKVCTDWYASVEIYQAAVEAELNRFQGETAFYAEQSLKFDEVTMPAYKDAVVAHTAQMQVYKEEQVSGRACFTCRSAVTLLVEKRSVFEGVVRSLETEKGNLKDLQGKLAETTQKLEDEKVTQETWNERKAAAEQAWTAQTATCQAATDKYEKSRNPFMAKCIPTFYDKSCEKSCIESQMANGCGVIEGTSNVPGKGQMELNVKCTPPQPSWVLAPVKYDKDAKEPEDMAQCSRIEKAQKVQYAQNIVKAGFLYKQNRKGGWDKRWFMLESGDSVRSARLKYVEASETSQGTMVKMSPAGKFINLWGRHVKKVPSLKRYEVEEPDAIGLRHVWTGSCFKLYTHYGDMKLCPPESAGLPEVKAWVEVLRGVINKD